MNQTGIKKEEEHSNILFTDPFSRINFYTDKVRLLSSFAGKFIREKDGKRSGW